MAKGHSGKLWSPGLLKSRGWTNELIQTLLSKPQYRRYNGRSVPHWRREEVQAAEASETFQKKSKGTVPKGAALQAAQTWASAAADLLETAWQSVPKEAGDRAWVLAGYYHKVIRDHLPAAARSRRLLASQVSGYLKQFFSLCVLME